MATLDEVRLIALSLPETTQSDHFNAPSFRVNKKIFAVLREPGRMTIKLDLEDQHNLVQGHPGVIEPVSGKGVRVASAARAGWTSVRYGLCDEGQIAELLRLAWSSVAPKRLLASPRAAAAGI
ncbi:MAG TPA: MmcQ/YjbR family DNA-binding protein [Caulobacteraceae bacterium]